MNLHPGPWRNASVEISHAIVKTMERYDLTAGEIALITSDWTLQQVRRVVREERETDEWYADIVQLLRQLHVSLNGPNVIPECKCLTAWAFIRPQLESLLEVDLTKPEGAIVDEPSPTESEASPPIPGRSSQTD